MPELIQKLTPSGEVAVFVDDDQFAGFESVMKCGYEIVAMFWHSVRPGDHNPYTSAAVHQMAHDDYLLYVGPDISTDRGGMSDAQLYADLSHHDFHYRTIDM